MINRNQSLRFRTTKLAHIHPPKQSTLVQNSSTPFLTCSAFQPRNRTLKPLQPLKKAVTEISTHQPPILEKAKMINRQTSITLKRASIQSNVTDQSGQSDEDYEIWDNNADLRVKKMVMEDHKPSVGQFLQLYKARFGGFPGQNQTIKNEEVIQAAVSHASSNKQLFKKYFPKKQVVFEDENDYSKPYKIEEDVDFHSFNNFFQNKKTQAQTMPKIPLKKY